MNNSETAAELARLRAELAALRQANDPARAVDHASPQSADPAGNTWRSADIDRQMKHIAKRVGEEAQERPLMTLLVVFALGVLLGRLIR